MIADVARPAVLSDQAGDLGAWQAVTFSTIRLVGLTGWPNATERSPRPRAQGTTPCARRGHGS